MPLSSVQELPLSLTVTADGPSAAARKGMNSAVSAKQGKVIRHAPPHGRDLFMADSVE